MVAARWTLGISHAGLCQQTISTMPTTTHFSYEGIFALWSRQSPIGSCTTGQLQFILSIHRQTVAVTQSPRFVGLSRRLRIVRKAEAFPLFSTEWNRPYLCHKAAHCCQHHIGSRILEFRSRFWQS